MYVLDVYGTPEDQLKSEGEVNEEFPLDALEESINLAINDGTLLTVNLDEEVPESVSATAHQTIQYKLFQQWKFFAVDFYRGCEGDAKEAEWGTRDRLATIPTLRSLAVATAGRMLRWNGPGKAYSGLLARPEWSRIKKPAPEVLGGWIFGQNGTQ